MQAALQRERQLSTEQRRQHGAAELLLRQEVSKLSEVSSSHEPLMLPVEVTFDMVADLSFSACKEQRHVESSVRRSLSLLSPPQWLQPWIIQMLSLNAHR